MDGGAPYLDSDRWVQTHDGCLEGLEGQVLVREDPELGEPVRSVDPVADTESDAGREVVLVGPEPRVALGLFEDVVEECIVAVVVHGGGTMRGTGARMTGERRSRGRVLLLRGRVGRGDAPCEQSRAGGGVSTTGGVEKEEEKESERGPWVGVRTL